MDREDSKEKVRKYLEGRAKKLTEEKTAQEPPKEAKPNSLVGWDLGLCVADVLSGKIKEEWVRTIFVTEPINEWEQLIDRCKITCWKEDPGKGEAIARGFISGGKVKESTEGRGSGVTELWMNVAGIPTLRRGEFVDDRNLD